MTNQNIHLYNEVLRHIKDTSAMDFLDNLANIKLCTSDFVPAILGAMNMSFPTAIPKSCWFHYGQEILFPPNIEGGFGLSIGDYL